MKKYYSIAIDGPAGAGKGTIAKGVAERLGYLYVDTGAMYRAFGLYFLQQGISLDNEELINQNIDNITIDMNYDENGNLLVYLNGTDVSSAIRTEEASRAASKVSIYEKVREKLVDMQKKLALKYNIVMEGRDIGTVVLPDATLKIYLTASVLERAKRRYLEQTQKGLNVTLEEIEKDIVERDYRDINRKISPLKKADDAILIDSSNMTIDEVIDEVIGKVKKYSKDR